MRVGDLAAGLGYRSREFIELAKARGITLGEPSSAVDARMAAAMRSLIPHRTRLSGDLKELYDRIGARRLPNRPSPEPSRKVSAPVRPRPAPPAVPARGGPKSGGDPFLSHLRDGSVKMFADTSSLMHEGSAGVFGGLVKRSLEATGQRLIVPGAVVKELEKHVSGRSGPESSRKQRQARQALRILEDLPVFHLIEDLRRLDDPFPDALFQNVFVKYRREFPLSLITQDVGLMVDILTQGRSHSIRGIKPITVWEIAMGGLRRVTLEAAAARLARRERLVPAR